MVISLKQAYAQNAAVPIPEKKAVIVLCDFTSSTDSATAKRNIKTNIGELFNDFSRNTCYYFYSIGTFLDPIVHDSIQAKKLKNSEAIERHYAEITQRLSKGSASNSCLISCLSMASDEIRTLSRDKSFKKFYLVVLSDMLEACNEDGKCFLDLERSKFSQANAWLNDWKPGSSNYANLPNLEIQIVFTTNKSVNSDRLKAFWLAYFKKAGFAGMPGFGVVVKKEGLQ